MLTCVSSHCYFEPVTAHAVLCLLQNGTAISCCCHKLLLRHICHSVMPFYICYNPEAVLHLSLHQSLRQTGHLTVSFALLLITSALLLTSMCQAQISQAKVATVDCEHRHD